MKTESKYGPLKRGEVRDDGYIFWAYQMGREVWYHPERFLKEQARDVEYRTAYAKLHSSRKAEVVRRWRKDNPARFSEHKVKHDERIRSANRWAAVTRYYHDLLSDLENPKPSRFKGHNYDGDFIRIYLTPRRAKMIHKFLTAHINEKQFVPV